MSERDAAAQLWAHIEEKTMVSGENLAQKFETPADAAEYYAPKLERQELEKPAVDIGESLPGRQTGSYAWRAARGELRN